MRQRALRSAGMARRRYKRHSVPVRVMHWVNALVLLILLMSGLQIFNAHPALYWGESSYNGSRPVFEITSRMTPGGNEEGVARVLGKDLTTTGVLGLSRGPDGELTERGFPSWITLPGPQWLAMGRRWHFFFAWLFVVNGLVYVVYSLWSRHLQRDLAPSNRDWRSVGHSILDHLRFRHPRGEAARHYNVLQKLTYLVVMFGLLPFMVLMGLGMSPAVDSIWPGWVGLFGGRQAVRTLHFLAALAIVMFVLIHVFEVLISGFWNTLRSMITGTYEIEVARGPSAAEDRRGSEAQRS